VHALDLVPPPTKLPVVVTVHDLTALEHPEFHPARRVLTQRAQLTAARRAQAVLCVSHATARRVIAHGVEPGKVVVSHLGVTPLPAPAAGADLPTRPYLLAVGELNRRKGHDVLLEAFAAAELDGMALVFAGPRGFDPRFYEQLADRLGVRSDTEILGTVDDATLAGLYRNAVALCFPSVAEGFGLPVLEALGAGVPVVASDLDAVREVADDNVLYVPAGDPTSLAAALRRIVEDEGLRARLVSGGQQRAAGFTWERTAKATVDAYRLALT
jgi:glycosyltransferase involved in cell wall biosynthesis